MEPTEIRRVLVPGLATAGLPFSHVVVDGTYAFLSGIVASDVPGGGTAHGDIAREAEIVMAAIREALAQMGLGMERIVRVQVHLTDISQTHLRHRDLNRLALSSAYGPRGRP